MRLRENLTMVKKHAIKAHIKICLVNIDKDAIARKQPEQSLLNNHCIWVNNKETRLLFPQIDT